MQKDNIKIKGLPVSGGLAIGEAQIVRDPQYQIVRKTIPVGRVKYEISRLEDASAKTIGELKATRSKAVKVIGEPGANIFDAQVMIASDEQFLKSVTEYIAHERVNAEYAYQEMLAQTVGRLEKAKDPYLRQMINDIRAVSERVLSFLLGVSKGDEGGFVNPTILVGRIFSPGQIMMYAKRNVVGFLTEEGGPASHMALIVRSLGIPAVMGRFDDRLAGGASLILDGNSGEVFINPDAETLRNYRRISHRKQSQPFAGLLQVKSINQASADGHHVALAANLELPGPLDEHLVKLGTGVGLYRTEFLYFSRQAFPDEEEQFQIYSHIARRFHPLPVTLRTFDLGGDKYADELGASREDNPALGCRGIRVAIDAQRLYEQQLRAMIRASAAGNIKILLPMITDAKDIAVTIKLAEKIKRELKRSKIPFDEKVKIGAMIEVPSAALAADYLAEMVDFFSIGTNDLIQYTMAADRGNHRVARYYTGHHPAVLRLIHMTVHAAHENHIPVTVCGELAGSRHFVPLLVGMGVDELSMIPTHLPGVSDWLGRLDYIEAKRFASRVLRLTTADKVQRALKEAYDYLRQSRKGGWLG
jgi:phosphoenolpyruvate-protein phosphotransferase (PTS system enzyme I)